MILQSLRMLAERERLIEQPAFQIVQVRWIIEIDEQGKFQTMEDTAHLAQADGNRRPRQEFKRMSVPRRKVRVGKVTKPEFLVDNAQYVLGIQPEGAATKQIPMTAYRHSFLDLLQKARKDVDSPALNAAVAFLENEEQRSRVSTDLKRRRFASNEWITFRNRGVLLNDAKELRNWWSRQGEKIDDQAVKTQCLVCGQLARTTRLHDNLKIPGANAYGVPLVSFNNPAFEKHGLIGNANAPVCDACMVAYVNALRRCLSDKYPRPDGGGTFPRQSMRLSSDTTAVYWDDRSSELTGTLSWLNNIDPSAVKEVLRSAWKCEQSAFHDARFYCLILTGTLGRAAVRGMHSSTVGQVAMHIERYFECMNAAGYEEQPAPFFALIRSLAVQGNLDSLSSGLAAELFLSAVLGKPLSERFLAAAVGRIRAERDVTRLRAALLSLYFQRKGSVVPMSLDSDSTDAAYMCGRLLAVLEALQINSRKGREPDSTIVDLFYAAASTRPAAVFPRLLSLGRNHLKTAPAGVFYSKQITDVLDGLDGANGFRPMLSIEQQGRFALGYFHQRANRFKKLAQAGETVPASIVPTTEENII